MVDNKKYENILASEDKYQSKITHNFSKHFFPSIRFFYHLIIIVYLANRKARKGIYDRFSWVHSSLKVIKSLENSGIKFVISGMDNLKKTDGPVVFISNHMSTLETMVLPSIIQPVKQVVFIIKKELENFPLFGKVALARHPIIVGRSNPRDDLKIVLEEGSKRIAKGRSIIVFPQKTREAYFKPKTFNTLGIKLARKNNVPVIPIAIISDAWGNGKIIKDFGKIDPNKVVKIAFGEPMEIEGNGNIQHQKSIDFIENKFIEWKKKEYIINE